MINHITTTHTTTLGFCLLSLVLAGPALAVEQTKLDLDEIIVSASPIERSRFTTIQGANVLSGTALVNSLEGSLGESLKKQAGITSTFYGPIASRPIIRGHDGARILILADGIGSIDAAAVSPDHQVAGGVANSERIEILRGPSALRFGTSAVGGIVNIIDGRIPEKIPSNGFAGSALGGYGTNARNGFVSGAFDSSAGNNFTVHAHGVWRSSQNYSAKGYASEEAKEERIYGRVPNSDGELTDVTGGFSYIWDHGLFGAAIEQFNSKYGIPGGHGEEHEEEGHEEEGHEEEGHEEEGHEEEGHEEEHADVRLNMKQTRIDGKAEVKDLTGFITWAQLRFTHGDYEHTEFEGTNTGTRFHSKGWEGRLEATHAALGPLEGSFGIQARRTNFSAVGEEAFVPKTTTNKSSLFLIEQTEFGSMLLEGGARLQRTSVNNPVAAIKRSFTSLALSANAGYEFIPDTIFGVSLSWTERPPTASELFSNGPHHATSSYEIGNNLLGEEEALNVEVTLRRQKGGLSGSVSFYTTWYDNFIYSRRTGNTKDELAEYRYTAADARFTGLEAELGWLIYQSADFNLSLDGQIDFVRATNSSIKKPLPRTPSLQYLLGVNAEWRRFTGRMEIEGASRQKKVAPLETATGGYTFFNARLAYQFEPGLRFVIKGQNLTNVLARQHTSFVKKDAPLPGRDIRFYVQATF